MGAGPSGVPVAANPSSPLHFRPARGRLCDTIPFFHDGEYHIFYIRCDTEGGVPWDHVVSRDLVHWYELPTALDRDPGDPHGPDGRDMFTGCVVEHDGLFHIFYTGHNPKNPDGAEIICHATSTDLVTWRKHREHCFGPDGAVYHPRDFRDPFVFRSEESGEWWMLLCDGLAGSDFSGIGRLVSTDLVTWKPAEPLLLDPPLLEGETGAPECPDLFRIGDYWHLLYTRRGQNIRRARHVDGPFTHGVPAQLDNTLLLAGKRLFDGRRHIYFGPMSGDHDDSVMNLPRELLQGDDGHLRFRPVREVVESFVDVVHKSADDGFDLPATGYRCPVPADYLMRCSLAVAEDATITIAVRADADGSGGTSLTIHAGRRSLELGPYHRSWGDAALPVITLQVFVLGTVIECFLDDRLAMVGRAYEPHGGYLSIVSPGNPARVLALEVREAPDAVNGSA